MRCDNCAIRRRDRLFSLCFFTSVGARPQRTRPPASVSCRSLPARIPMDVLPACASWAGSRDGTSPVERRWAAGREDQLPTMAADLVRLKMDVIVTLSTPAAVAAKQAERDSPSSSLRRRSLGQRPCREPGSTGRERHGHRRLRRSWWRSQRLELLKQVASKASRIAVLGSRLGSPSVRGETSGRRPKPRAVHSESACNSSR